MTKTNVWVSVVAALLAIGTLVGLVFSLRKISDVGGGDKTTVKVPTVDDTKKPAETTKKPAETTAPKRETKTVVTNANAKYFYSSVSRPGQEANRYVAYSDELKPNTKYLIKAVSQYPWLRSANYSDSTQVAHLNGVTGSLSFTPAVTDGKNFTYAAFQIDLAKIAWTK